MSIFARHQLGSKLLVFGTVQGQLVLLDRFGKFLGSCGSISAGDVTSVDLSPDCDVCAVGYQNGTVCIWDTATRQELKSIPDAHSFAVCFVRFLPSSSLSGSSATGATASAGSNARDFVSGMMTLLFFVRLNILNRDSVILTSHVVCQQLIFVVLFNCLLCNVDSSAGHWIVSY